jgi:hypothetical protein
MIEDVVITPGMAFSYFFLSYISYLEHVPVGAGFLAVFYAYLRGKVGPADWPRSGKVAAAAIGIVLAAGLVFAAAEAATFLLLQSRSPWEQMFVSWVVQFGSAASTILFSRAGRPGQTRKTGGMIAFLAFASFLVSRNLSALVNAGIFWNAS